jgi:hypothetical protein
MRYDVSDLVWSVIEPDGPFRERCPRYNTRPLLSILYTTLLLRVDRPTLN